MSAPHDVKLQEIYERVHKLNPEFAVVGWFSAHGKMDACIPLSELRVVTIAKERVAKERREWVLSMLPAILYDRVVHINGRWFEHRENHAVKHSLEPLMHGHTAGVRKLLSPRAANDVRSVTWFLQTKMGPDQRLIDWAHLMTDEEHLEAQPDFNKYGDDHLLMPAFLTPVPSREYAVLRDTPEFYRALLHCARFGRWNIRNIHGLVAPGHGKAEYIDPYNVKFTYADRDGDPDATTETFSTPAAAIGERIYKIFGVEPLLDLIPVPTKEKGVWMAPPQTMFMPIQPKQYTLEQLREHPNYEAMCFMTALNSAEGPHALSMMDYSLAHSHLTPWVYMNALPCRIHKVKMSPRILWSEGSEHSIDLFNAGQQLFKSYRRLHTFIQVTKSKTPPAPVVHRGKHVKHQRPQKGKNVAQPVVTMKAFDEQTAQALAPELPPPPVTEKEAVASMQSFNEESEVSS